MTDITEHPTEEGKLYCAAVMDAYSRRIIGYSMADHLRTELVLDALSMAIVRRPPARQETILHSDHGTRGCSLDRYWVHPRVAQRAAGSRIAATSAQVAATAMPDQRR